jgi:pyruvate dehydrogenase E2 component (dihydrolipoamide acetyltransferase)
MDLKLPPLGEGVDSGSVVGILVREGDQIAKGQGIIELETGKAVAPVPSPAAGKVTKILVAIGDKISVGQPILSLEGGAAAGPRPPPASSAPRARPVRKVRQPRFQRRKKKTELAAEEEPDGRHAPPPAASPTIRRLARELGIDLRRIHGSENGGTNRHGRRAGLHPAPATPGRAAAQSRQAAGGPAKPARRASTFPNGARSPNAR